MKNNAADQAMLGDFPKVLDDAVIGSGQAHQEQQVQLLSDTGKMAAFGHLIFEMMKEQLSSGTSTSPDD